MPTPTPTPTPSPTPTTGRQTYGNNGSPWAIGSGTVRIQGENYDQGGEGVAYHDADSGNNGGQYRNDGVDIESAVGGGYDVGWINAGEWLEYTVNVATAGSYNLKLHVARQPTGTSAVKVLFGGADKTGDITVPSTGGWQTWTDVTTTVNLAAGTQVMRLSMSGGNFNVDWVELSPATSSGGVVGSGTFWRSFSRMVSNWLRLSTPELPESTPNTRMLSRYPSNGRTLPFATEVLPTLRGTAESFTEPTSMDKVAPI